MEIYRIEDVKSIAEIAPKSQKKDFKNILLTATKAIISTVLIYYILRKTNLNEIWISIKSANLYLLLLSFSLHAVGYYASAYRWRILSATQDMNFSVSYLVQSYAVAMFFNNVLPSTIGGDAIRAYDSWRKGYSKLKSIATVGVERFIGMFALLVFATIALALTGEVNRQVPYIWLWVVIIFLLMLIIIQGIFIHEGKAKRLSKIIDLPGFKIFRKQIKKFADAFVNFKGQNKALIYSLALSLLLQINVIFHYFLISEALGLGIPFIKFWIIIPLALFIQMIPISINAIGIRENLYVFFFNIYGAPVASAVAFSWIAYGMILFLGIVGGIIYVLRK